MLNIEASEISIVVSFILSLVLSFLFYYRDKNNSETAKFIKYILIVSRFFCLFLVLFLLFSPFIISKKEVSIDPTIVCLIDDSKSMKINNESIRIEVDSYIKDLEKSVSENARLKKYYFSDVLNESDSSKFEGESSNILNAFYSLSDLHQNENISSIILISDGIINSGGSELSNPLNVPVFSIGMGDTSKIKDALIQSVYYNDISYTGNSFPIEVSGIVHNMKGKDQQLLVKYDGVIVLDSVIVPNSQRFLLKCQKMIKAESSGTKIIEVEIKNKIVEKTLENNSLKRFVKVLDNRQQIGFVYDDPHPDVRAVKSVFKNDENYKVFDYRLKDDCPSLKQFNVLVFIGGGKNDDLNRWYQKAKNEKVNTFWIMGVNNLCNTEDFSIKKLDASKDEAELAIEKGFSLFKTDDKLNEFLKSSPPLSVPFGKWRIKNINQNLAKQKINGVETNYPLITFSANDDIRNAFVLGEGVWRWKLKEKDEKSQFDILFRKIIQYLSVKEDKSSFRFKVESVVSNREDLIVEAEYYNPSFELENSEELNVSLINSKNEKFSYQFLKVDNKYRLNFGVLEADNYVLESKKNIEGREVTLTTPVIVESRSLESLELVANHEILKELSESTNGKFYAKNDLKSFIDDMKSVENYKTLRYSEVLKEELLKNSWILFVIIALLAMEWFVRKWEGIV